MTSFNWHELDHNSFLSWMVVNLVTAKRKENEDESEFDRLNSVTDSFRKVDMKITINGIDIPVDYFVKQVQSNMKFYAQQAANNISEDLLERLQDEVSKIEDALVVARDAIQAEVDFFFKE